MRIQNKELIKIMDANGASNNGITATSTATTATVVSAAAICNNNNNNNNNHNEQPQTKRQKIEKIKGSNKLATSTTITATVTAHKTTPPPDIIDTNCVSSPNSITTATIATTAYDTNGNNTNIVNNHHHHHHHQHHHLCSSSLSSSSTHSLSTTSSPPSNNSPTTTPCSSRAASYAQLQLLNVQNLVNNILPTATAATTTATINGTIQTINSNAAANTTLPTAALATSVAPTDEVDRAMVLPDLLSMTTTTQKHQTHHNYDNNAASTSTICSSAADMREFEQSLSKQCLCGVSERTLRKPFQSHYSHDAYGQKRIANLSEWPTNKLMQFLSNLQLLFDIYLKQNSKGFICTRIMDICDALIRNDHNLIDEIIVLAGYNNTYVQFLAGRVLAAFLVIAKQSLNDDWLKKIVDNLFNYERLDHLAVQKIHFSLDIIKRIVEWKDVELHPLEDEIAANVPAQDVAGAAQAGSSRNSVVSDLNTLSYMHFPTQQPTLENNYFAVHFRNAVEETNAMHATVEHNHNADVVCDDDDHDDEVEVERHAHNDAAAAANTVNQHITALNNLYGLHASTTTSAAATTSQSSSAAQVPTLLTNAGCNLVTLTDFESFDTTHLKCITIQKLENKWPALVKNMSALMSASNQQTHEYAEHCILNFLQLWENIISVKANLSIDETRPFYAQLDKFELLLNQNLSCTVYKQMLCLFNEALCYGSTLALQDMLPDETCQLAHQIVRHVKDYSILESLPRRQPENIVSLIGFKRSAIVYAVDSLQTYTSPESLTGSDAIEMDKTILQKMVLLVLKSIAVTVKEIRSDSSDSSIDSTDYDAFQDMLLIERSIRDVLSKLESFIKHTLEFHPECHFSKILIHLFDDQDDHLIEAMICTLDVTSGISFRNNAFPELVSMLNPVYTFLEFLKMTSNSSDLLLDLLVSNETCFLLYLLRFLKYIRMNWAMFVQSCHDFGMGHSQLDEAMSVLIRLRLQISRLVSRQLYPYDISPVLRLLESCESLYEGNELS